MGAEPLCWGAVAIIGAGMGAAGFDEVSEAPAPTAATEAPPWGWSACMEGAKEPPGRGANVLAGVG